MKISTLLTAALGVLMLTTLTPTHAEASNTCREYTKTIRIDGRLETGVGVACQRNDNSWEIVDLNGKEVVREIIQGRIYDDLSNDGYRIVTYSNNNHYVRRSRPVYYSFSYTGPKHVKKHSKQKQSYKNYKNHVHRY